jgi:hypothetical protein
LQAARQHLPPGGIDRVRRGLLLRQVLEDGDLGARQVELRAGLDLEQPLDFARVQRDAGERRFADLGRVDLAIGPDRLVGLERGALATLAATSSSVAGTFSASATASCFSVVSSISVETISPAFSLPMSPAPNPMAWAIWSAEMSAAPTGPTPSIPIRPAARIIPTVRILTSLADANPGAS